MDAHQELPKVGIQSEGKEATPVGPLITPEVADHIEAHGDQELVPSVAEQHPDGSVQVTGPTVQPNPEAQVELPTQPVAEKKSSFMQGIQERLKEIGISLFGVSRPGKYHEAASYLETHAQASGRINDKINGPTAIPTSLPESTVSPTAPVEAIQTVEPTPIRLDVASQSPILTPSFDQTSNPDQTVVPLSPPHTASASQPEVPAQSAVQNPAA